jgi:hypothetical protein
LKLRQGNNFEAGDFQASIPYYSNPVIKNPNTVVDSHEDPLVLLKQYNEAAAIADQSRLALKSALQSCLEHSTGAGQ